MTLFVIFTLLSAIMSQYGVEFGHANVGDKYTGPAFSLGKEKAIYGGDGTSNAYNVYFRIRDRERSQKRVPYPYSVENGDHGDIFLEPWHIYGRPEGNQLKWVEYWTPSGYDCSTWDPFCMIHPENELVELANPMTFGFETVLSPKNVDGIYKIRLQILKDGQLLDDFYVGFVMRGTRGWTGDPNPIVHLDSPPVRELRPGDVFNVVLTFENSGSATTEGTWGDGVQIYLENGEFTSVTLNDGFSKYLAFDPGSPNPRPVEGARVVEIYDFSMSPGKSDWATLSVKANGSPGSNVQIRYAAWMVDAVEELTNFLVNERAREFLIFRTCGGGSPIWPFNNEWAGTSHFTDSVESSDPVVDVPIVGPTEYVTIVVNTDPPGLDNPVGSGTYAVGTSVDIGVDGVPGYTFQGWRYDGHDWPGEPNTEMHFAFIVYESHTFTAVFTPSSCPDPSYPEGTWNRKWCAFETGDLKTFITETSVSGSGSYGSFDEDWSYGNVGPTSKDNYVGFKSGRQFTLDPGTYAIKVGTDDGMRVWVNGQLVIDKWFHPQPYTKYDYSFTVQSRGTYEIRIDWYEYDGAARDSFDMTMGPLPSANLQINVSPNPVQAGAGQCASVTFTLTEMKGVGVNVDSYSWVFVYPDGSTGPNGNPSISIRINPSSSTTWNDNPCLLGDVAQHLQSNGWISVILRYTFKGRDDGGNSITALPVDLTINLSTTPFAFSISTPSAQLTLQGGSATFSFTVTTTTGTPQPLTLSIANQPAGTTLSWNPGSTITPSISGTSVQLIITTTCSTGAQTYSNLEIHGSGGGASAQSSSFTLTVNILPSCPNLPCSIPTYPSGTWDLNWYTYTGNLQSPQGSCIGSGALDSGINPTQLNFDKDFGYGGVSGKVDFIYLVASRSVALQPGTYAFTIGGDDGIRLAINGQIPSALDGWKQPQYYTQYTYIVTYSSPTTVQLRLEWFEQQGAAKVSFSMQPVNVTTASSITATTISASTFTATTVSASTSFTATNFDFSMVASPDAQSVTQGGSASYSITVNSLTGQPHAVSLMVAACPTGATCSFSNPSVSPGFSSTLTVSTSSSTAGGWYAITIMGSGGGATRDVSVSLTVTVIENPGPLLAIVVILGVVVVAVALVLALVHRTRRSQSPMSARSRHRYCKFCRAEMSIDDKLCRSCGKSQA